MPDRREVARGRSLRRIFVVPFVGFVLAACLGVVLWSARRQQAESLKRFAAVAGENAGFIDRLRLPRSPALAKQLGEVLGVGVGFRSGDGRIVDLPSELAGQVDRLAGDRPGAGRSGGWEMALAPLEGGSMHLVLVRERTNPLGEIGGWVLPALIVSALGGSLAMLVSRRIVGPISSLERWLPNLERESPEPLPSGLAERGDEIGALARSLEEGARRLRDEVERRRRSERLAALGRVATSLAHEIRNPAAAIALHADLLRAAAGEDGTESLAMIREEVERITDLVNEWLFLARPSPPSRSRQDLAGLVRRVEARLRPQLGYAGVEVVFSGEERAEVQADGDRISQVLRNLLLNAMQAMPEGGRIGVVLRREGGDQVVEVRDGGRGFGDEALRRWSEPFFSEREGGMGIGLTLSAEILRAHGGALEVGNMPGGGACVRFRLAAADHAGSGSK